MSADDQPGVSSLSYDDSDLDDIGKLLENLNITSVDEFLKQYDYDHLFPPVVHHLSSSASISLMVCYILIFCLGLIGNLLVIIVVAANRSMQTVTNVFIVSLAVSDVMISVLSVPFTLVEAITAGWVMGLFMCKLVNFMTLLSAISSVLTLTCIAVDRYNAICQPLKSRIIHTTTRAAKLLCFVWSAAVIMASPLLFVFELHVVGEVRNDQNYTLCQEMWRYPQQKMAFTFFLVAVTYLVPLGLMLFLYVRICHHLWVRNPIGPTDLQQLNAVSTLKYKKKATKMLVLVVVLFFICWTPYHVVTVRREFPSLKDNEKNRLLVACITLLALSNSCLNPIVYAFLNGNFKQSFVATLKCRKTKVSPINITQNVPLSGSNI
ncbi:QRFP-like peptide receptor [Ptychodera flava]|uniref:QRFP-like peptide receptor n=1 Tax=Ptychodera flava TaxID=63121 RepID=UPI00396A0A2C